MTASFFWLIAAAVFGLAWAKTAKNDFQATTFTNTTEVTVNRRMDAEQSQVAEEASKTNSRCLPGKAGLECRKAKKKQRIAQSSMSFSDNLAVYELRRRTCRPGDYYDIGKNTCERCEGRCNEDDLTMCGLECRAYFTEKRLTEEGKLANENLREENEMLQTLVYTFIGFTFVLLLFTIIMAWSYYKDRKEVKSLRDEVCEMKRKTFKTAEGDRQDDDNKAYTESAEMLPG